MSVAVLIRSMMVFLLFLVTLAMNGEDNLIARVGFESNYGLILLLSVLFTMILAGRSTYIVAGAVILSLVANMPADFTLNFGVDRDYFAGIMLALLLQPVVARVMS